MTSYKAPVIVHIIHRLNVGGLENGLVNLINHLPEEKYRHAIVCLTETSEFANRISRKDVKIYELHKRDGKDPIVYFRLWKLLRKIRPTIVHTRNIATLDMSVIAALAGVPIRIHGEHGRDIFDLHGKHKRYQKLRRLCAPFIHRFIAMSKDLEDWLEFDVGIKKEKTVQLYNGVDITRFQSAASCKLQRNSMPPGFADSESIILGTVGRLEPVKDQLSLVHAFVELKRREPKLDRHLRLVLLGDGSLMHSIVELIEKFGIQDQVWLAGSQNNVQDILSEMDIFVLPSLGEGISNTILEAMACGLPVIATDVGGNPELVEKNITGELIPAAQPVVMAEAMQRYVNDQALVQSQGLAGRKRVETLFSLTRMVNDYLLVYDSLLSSNG